jgi:hypothetical protein
LLSKEKRVKVPTALTGCQVWRSAFDYQVRLTLIARDPGAGYRVDAELVIETPFLLRDAAGEWHELDPGTGSRLAPVLDLFMRTITTGARRRKGGGVVAGLVRVADADRIIVGCRGSGCDTLGELHGNHRSVSPRRVNDLMLSADRKQWNLLQRGRVLPQRRPEHVRGGGERHTDRM